MRERHGVWPTSRPLARRIGTTHFFTGRPCRRGHLSLRVTATGNCLQCKREAQRPSDIERLNRWKAENESPEVRQQIEARFRATHRDERNAKKREVREYDRFMRQLERGA